jgi:hypothetical protein
MLAIRIKNYSAAHISSNLGHQSSFKQIVSLGFHVIFSDYSLPSIKGYELINTSPRHFIHTQVFSSNLGHQSKDQKGKGQGDTNLKV